MSTKEQLHSVVLHSVKLFVTQWTAAHQASLYFTVSQSLLKFISTESVMPSNHLILCRPLLLLHSRVFRVNWWVFYSESVFESGSQNIGASASASVLPMTIQFVTFRIDWFDLLAVQRALQSSLQHVWKHQFFSAHPSLWSSFLIRTWLLEKP